jgi:hypothetical protein
LREDVDEKPTDAEAELIDRKVIGRRRDQADARRDLRREGAGEGEKQDPENESSHTKINAETAEHAEKGCSQRSPRALR